jgi:hypothetical protein
MAGDAGVTIDVGAHQKTKECGAENRGQKLFQERMILVVLH